MILNMTSKYAIKIMTFIANNEDSLHNAKNISNKLDISYKYLTRIMTQLVTSNILLSIRGRDGGYRLTKKANEIKILDILNSVGESFESENCVLGTKPCEVTNKCALHDKWETPKNEITNIFRNSTLEDLKEN